MNYAELYNVLPTGRNRIPMGGTGRAQTRQNNLSYFGNGNFKIGSQLNISGSIRWDGSNLFGVKANQKGVSLWSVGSSYDFSTRIKSCLPFFL